MKVKQDKTASKKLGNRMKGRLESKFQNESAEADVKHKIEDAFRRSAELGSGRIMVSVHDGTVELWGSVRTWAGIREAERVSSAVPGVSKVDAHLYIGR